MSCVSVHGLVYPSVVLLALRSYLSSGDLMLMISDRLTDCSLQSPRWHQLHLRVTRDCVLYVMLSGARCFVLLLSRCSRSSDVDFSLDNLMRNVLCLCS